MSKQSSEYITSIFKLSSEIAAFKDRMGKTFCPNGSTHMFEIVKNSGRNTGTPSWKCKTCGKTVKSN
jgi:transposase-like protein